MIEKGTRPRQSPRSGRLRAVYIVPALCVLAVVAAAAVAVATISSKPSLSIGRESLASVSLPFGGGHVVRVAASGGTEQRAVPVTVRGNEVWPVGQLPPGGRVTVEVTVKRPGWISWLSGATELVRLTETTPETQVRSKFVTRRHGQPLKVHFSQPVSMYAYRAADGHLRRVHLDSASSQVTVPAHAVAGTVAVGGAVRSWERMKLTPVSWFPAGAKASVVAHPAPGSSITPSTGITLTFSKRVSAVLGKDLPAVTPTGTGVWHHLNSHTIRFEPAGYGYGLGAHVSVHLPDGVQLLGGEIEGSDPVGHWSVPAGSTERLQQLLADLGYLPVSFAQVGDVGATVAEQERAAVDPPAGSFNWRYPNTPSSLKAIWNPKSFTELTKGAVMMFEDQHGMTVDGVAGPSVWKALIEAAIKGQKSTFGYTYVNVSESTPETVTVWHDGKVVVHGLANTGIAAAPTATGTFAVFEHLPVGTMSGTNPDGTTYHDPGIKWISYFNGGDALHQFVRASYGFPQSLGCVEMPDSEAGQVYPYTPIGTIVNVAS